MSKAEDIVYEEDAVYADDAPRAVLFGCSGATLTAQERAFFKAADPLGFILFARNCESPDQIRELVADLRDCARLPTAPILIDQEGGRVARLQPPHWRAAPPAAVFGTLARQAPGDAVEAARINARLIAHELFELGITVNCAPVLDVPVAGAHEIIGDRALDEDPHVVGLLGRAVCEGMLEGGILPVLKHVPGHGRAAADSHETLPVVNTSRAELEETDFVPFRMLNDMPCAMTAHVTFTAIDRNQPATLSSAVVDDVIRDEIGFDGLLMTDDMSMKALTGPIGDNAARALAAGCDVVLHCNGDMAEMENIADTIGPSSDLALERLATADDMRDPVPDPIDPGAAVSRLVSLLKAA